MAGIAYVVVFVALFAVVGDSPALSDPAAEFRQWFEDNETQVALLTWGASLAVPGFFLLFASGLRSQLGPADAKNEGVWSRLSFAGAVLMAAVGGAGLAFWAVLANEEVLAVASDETVKTLAAFDTIIFIGIVPWASAVFVLGASVVIVQSGVMARWLGWFGFVIVLLTVIGNLWLFSGDETSFLGVVALVAFIGFLVWTLIVAVSLMRMDEGATA